MTSCRREICRVINYVVSRSVELVGVAGGGGAGDVDRGTAVMSVTRRMLCAHAHSRCQRRRRRRRQRCRRRPSSSLAAAPRVICHLRALYILGFVASTRLDTLSLYHNYDCDRYDERLTCSFFFVAMPFSHSNTWHMKITSNVYNKIS